MAKDFESRIFEFTSKQKVRIYKLPSVHNFLVQNIDGKWLYWELVHVLEVTNKQSLVNSKSSIFITPEEMKHAQ